MISSFVRMAAKAYTVNNTPTTISTNIRTLFAPLSLQQIRQKRRFILPYFHSLTRVVGVNTNPIRTKQCLTPSTTSIASSMNPNQTHSAERTPIPPSSSSFASRYFAKDIRQSVIRRMTTSPSESIMDSNENGSDQCGSNDDDDPSISRNGGDIIFFSTSTPTSVSDLLRATIRTLENDEKYTATLEPIMSTVHLLAMVLQLSWENGYYDLLQIVNNQKERNGDINISSSTSSLASRIVTIPELQLFHTYIIRRMIHNEPIQYICGQWDFLSSTFYIEAPLLCPRPETEELTTYAIQDIRTTTIIINQRKQQQQQQDHGKFDNISERPFRVLDIGCGTGCIGISIAKEIPESFVTAIDVEPTAVQVSNRNAERILSNERQQHRYVAQCIDIEQFGSDIKRQQNNDDDDACSQLFDMVVSNPPYILPRDMDTLDASVSQYESHTALNGGGTDGLNVIRTILQQLPYICQNHAICWLEIDPSQPKLIQEYVQILNDEIIRSDELCSTNTASSSNSINGAKKKAIRFIECVKDMFGHDRFVKLLVQIVEV